MIETPELYRLSVGEQKVTAEQARADAWDFWRNWKEGYLNTLSKMLNDYHALENPLAQIVYSAAFLQELSEIHRGKKTPTFKEGC